MEWLQGTNASAEAFAKLNIPVQELPMLAKEVQENLMHRPGGAVSLAVGMAHIFNRIPFLTGLMSYWYHFAIMFEAVFILTAVDAGTRVGRFFLQEMFAKVLPKFGDSRWRGGIFITSNIFTGAWGFLEYTGNISAIWPLFGMSNQLLASCALIIATSMLIRMGKSRYAWIYDDSRSVYGGGNNVGGNDTNFQHLHSKRRLLVGDNGTARDDIDGRHFPRRVYQMENAVSGAELKVLEEFFTFLKTLNALKFLVEF